MKSNNNKELDSSVMELLEKGKKGAARVLFSRTGLIILIMLLQIGIFFLLLFKFARYWPQAIGISIVFDLIMILYLLNCSFDNSAKVTWLVVIMLLPVFGTILLFYTQSNLGHRLLKKRLTQVLEDTREQLKQDEKFLKRQSGKHQKLRLWLPILGAAVATLFTVRVECSIFPAARMHLK